MKKALRELRKGQALVLETRSKNPKMVNCIRFESVQRDPSHQILVLAKNVVSKKEILERLGRAGFDEEQVMGAISELVRDGMLKYHFVEDQKYPGHVVHDIAKKQR